MAGVGTGTTGSSRGRGGKFKKYTRGGGKHFSRDLQPVDSEGNPVSMWSADAQQNEDEEGDEEEEDEDEEEEGDGNNAGPSKAESREDRKAQKKARKEAAIAKSQGRTVEVGDMPSSDEEEEEEEDDDMPANPNHSKAARKQALAPVGNDEDVDDLTEGVKRLGSAKRGEKGAVSSKAKLREEARAGKEETIRRADLERLDKIREEREAAKAVREAEAAEREAASQARGEALKAKDLEKDAKKNKK